MKVFISSVIADFEEFRAAAARAAETLGHQVLRAEDFSAQSDSPRIACLSAVRDADLVILLMGARYGEIQQESGLSATHEEYREARERCPVLVMVQSAAEREGKQAGFLQEVRDWGSGHLTGSFSDPESLRDAATGALHRHELAQAGGEVDADGMLEDALELLPRNPQGFGYEAGGFGPASLALALVGGPQETVLRPSELDSKELQEHLGKLALFGETRIFAAEHGVTPYAEDGDALVLFQEGRQVNLYEDGSIKFKGEFPKPPADASYAHIPVAIEEEVCDLISGFLKFSSAVLDRIDATERLTHVAVAIRTLGADHLSWKTRQECAEASAGHGFTMGVHGQGELEPIHLEPPHRTRAALRGGAEDMAEDLTALLRRQFKGK